MPERPSTDDLLVASRDVGVSHPPARALEAACRAALDVEIERERRRAIPPRSPRVWVAGALVVAALAGGGAAIGDGILAQGVPSNVAAHFAVLRRPVRPADAMPPAFVAQATNPNSLVVRTGVNPALARRARGLTSGTAWVIPANGEICLATSPPGFPGVAFNGCGGDAGAIAGREFSFATSGRGQWIAGLVPDKVSRVILTLSDGSSRTVTVRENVYTALVGGHVVSRRFTNPAGRVVRIAS